VNLLQHLPLTDVPKVLQELTRVTRKAVYIQAEFAPVDSPDIVQSGFPNADGSVTTFNYNYVGFDKLDLPGWAWRRIVDSLQRPTKDTWPSQRFVYDPDTVLYFLSTIAGKENQFVVLERKYNYPIR
jgi:hypothetical protein